MGDTTRIIIQARMGSTRMPGKAVAPFFRDKGIFEIITENIVQTFGRDSVVLATTTHSSDDVLVAIAKQIGIGIFRGSENNVLERFIGAARQFDAEVVVRVCADNPFLMPEYIRQLIDADQVKNADYISFDAGNSIPVIRSHWGLFAEVVKRSALENALAQNIGTFYQEHVTNYIYGHPEQYAVQLIPLPTEFHGRKDYRFTIDTPEDFQMQRDLYLALFERYHTTVFTPEQLFRYIDATPGLKSEMEKQIARHAK